ncbi:hypothetical protein Hokovirus_2_34 [Hokovirus HKV1]|uniref:Uncharacterized protein n=1 Tax=Hokovirus HKV1 TaxID=1977638 RepID=A0A1V0SFL6_9VIRU|nr:hypothetical protein Hokovirus_2_34 [Hokovirus HKV1]
MAFTTIHLNVYQYNVNDLIFKQKDSQLVIQKEQLYDAYDFIILNCLPFSEHACDFLVSQDYFCFHSNIVNRYYINNKLKNIDIFFCNAYKEIRNTHYKYFKLGDCPELLQDSLPCLMHGAISQIDVEYLSNYFKITEINTSNIYYIERKNINIKAAIKRT